MRGIESLNIDPVVSMVSQQNDANDINRPDSVFR